MKFKAGVRLSEDLKPQTVFALLLCETLYSTWGVEPTVTSVNDGTHMRRSKHYTGRAFDLRIKDVPRDHRGRLVDDIRKRLVPLGYDVVWEAQDRPNEHLHIEFDPK